MSKSFRKSLDEQLRNPEFKKEWDAFEPEFQVIGAMIDARQRRQITQKEPTEITGIEQTDISRLENRNANPSLDTLKRLAAGLGMAVKVELVPVANIGR